MTLDLDLSGLGRAATVLAPEDPWSRFTSTRFGYSMAHPADWTVSEEGASDSYLIDGTPYVTAGPQSLPGYTLERFATELIATYKKQAKVEPETNAEIVLGGQPGRFLTYHFANEDGVKVYVADAITVADGTGWEVIFMEQAGVGGGRHAHLRGDAVDVHVHEVGPARLVARGARAHRGPRRASLAIATGQDAPSGVHLPLRRSSPR